VPARWTDSVRRGWRDERLQTVADPSRDQAANRLLLVETQREG
jgi:hypothetical protein